MAMVGPLQGEPFWVSRSGAWGPRDAPAWVQLRSWGRGALACGGIVHSHLSRRHLGGLSSGGSHLAVGRPPYRRPSLGPGRCNLPGDLGIGPVLIQGRDLLSWKGAPPNPPSSNTPVLGRQPLILLERLFLESNRPHLPEADTCPRGPRTPLNPLTRRDSRSVPSAPQVPVRTSGQGRRSVVSGSRRPHGLQHARPPCPLPTPGAYSQSCPSSQ